MEGGKGHFYLIASGRVARVDELKKFCPGGIPVFWAGNTIFVVFSGFHASAFANLLSWQNGLKGYCRVCSRTYVRPSSYQSFSTFEWNFNL